MARCERLGRLGLDHEAGDAVLDDVGQAAHARDDDRLLVVVRDRDDTAAGGAAVGQHERVRAGEVLGDLFLGEVAARRSRPCRRGRVRRCGRAVSSGPCQNSPATVRRTSRSAGSSASASMSRSRPLYGRTKPKNSSSRSCSGVSAPVRRGELVVGGVQVQHRLGVGDAARAGARRRGWSARRSRCPA